jgi:hypothetical protein
MMKRRFVLAAIGTLVASRGWAQAAAWSDHRSEEGNFHVQLPGKPTLSTSAVSIGNNETAPVVQAVLGTPGATYQVVYISYPRRISGAASADVLLDTFRNNMASGVSYRGESKLMLGRFPGREFVLVESDASHRAVRLYWIRGKLYQLLVSGKPGIEARPDTRKFFDSFALNTA